MYYLSHHTRAAYAAWTHSVLEDFFYGGHVGGHFGKKSCTYYSFVSKVLCKKFGAKRPTSHFGGHVGDHFGKKLHILIFCNEGNVYKTWGRKTNISFFTGWAFGNGGHIGSHFGEKVDEKLHLNAKVLCVKFGLKIPDGLEE